MAVSGPLGTYPGIGSPGPSPSSPSSPSSGSQDDTGLSGGAIAGSVIGAVCCLGISVYVASKAGSY